ncbi:MAG TPA: right-handed parallel beta-helix repeat-containing protein [Actinomycetota bacterium]|nr:right-handed parallel beta-helix repeat-containing protein [Actinomycetota bacterium]
MSISIRSRLVVAVALVLSLVASSGVAFGHAERDAAFPDGSGEVPTYRPMIAEPNLVVCADDSRKRIMEIEDAQLRTDNLKLAAKCRYRNLQDAVFAVERPGTTIYMLPGVYREEPYRAQPKCAERLAQESEDEGAPILTYEEQLQCPHAQNLIGIFGDIKPTDDKRECNAPQCDLQIEGTGDDPEDVLITGGFTKDGQWMKLNGIRGDRADGLYLKNFTIELFEFNAVYLLETDGFVIDEVIGRWNDEYAFLTFAVDHGLYKNCEGYNNGDSAIYPGSASNVNNEDGYGQKKRWSIEIRNCKAHHNAAGYSGTAGNSVYVHDNDFYANQTGMVTDSIYPNHPGLPQDHAWVVDNDFYSNNVNYTEEYVQSGICDKPPAERGYKPEPGEPKWAGAVCPVIPAPVGAGMVIAGGNWNLIEKNRVWDNWRAGFMLISVPAVIREEPEKGFDTSHFNMYANNIMGLNPQGKVDLNGLDWWWDDQGEGNCWENNKGAEGDVTSNTMYPTGLPTCESGGSYAIPNNPYKTGSIAGCALYNRNDPIFRDPPGCPFFDTPEEP